MRILCRRQALIDQERSFPAEVWKNLLSLTVFFPPKLIQF
jgi:hypothetical protein